MLKVAFLRNILLLSLLIAFSLPFYEVYFIHPAYRNMLIEQTEQEAVRYGNYLVHTLALDQNPLQREKIPPAMARDVGVLRKDRQLIKLRIFSPAGEIIFSTKESEVGKINQKEYFVNIVAKGGHFSKVVEKDAQTADGQESTIDVVETYVPIMGVAGFHGAIEVYYDISQALASLNALTRRSNLMLVAIALGLLAAILVSVRRAYVSHCAQQNTEELLLQSNEKLEQRVVDRTKDLKDANLELRSEVAEHLLTTKSLQRANNFNRTVLNSMSDAVSIIDAKTYEVIDYNMVFHGSLDAETVEVIGNTCYELTHGLKEPCADPDLDCPLQETIKTGNYATSEHRHPDRDGKIRFVEVSTSPIFDDGGKVIQVVHVCRDITERKLAADEVMQMAYYDPLTDLPNRRLLLDRLQVAIPQAVRKESKMALLFLDLDRFKEINDSRGHSCGDQILQEVAKRLKKIVRESDTLARLGGDEFVFLLTQIETEIDATVVADKILEAIREPICLDSCQVHMTTSVGISVFPNDGRDSDVLLKGADLALYAAKSSGRNLYRFFSDKMNQQAQERHELENRMHQALEEQQFSLVYQPQVDLETAEIIGVEALARWHSPELGVVSPCRFIPVAEECGLIQQLGDWVLETACRQAKNWLDGGTVKRCVAVNISVRQFQQPDFVEKVKSVLADTELPANLLELELTESLLMQNGVTTVEVLQQLKELGVRLSIDDFGTGYSSLSYLKNFPIDRIKIDQSFVRDINDDENDRVIVETIIAMAERLGLEVIAEGVETEEQRDALLSRNCSYLQGFLYSKALPPEELDAFIINNELQLRVV